MHVILLSIFEDAIVGDYLVRETHATWINKEWQGGLVGDEARAHFTPCFTRCPFSIAFRDDNHADMLQRRSISIVEVKK